MKSSVRYIRLLFSVIFCVAVFISAPGYANKPASETTDTTSSTLTETVGVTDTGETSSITYLNRIVMFHDWVTSDQKSAFIYKFRVLGCSVAEDLSFINGILLKTPQRNSLSWLQNDERVAVAEEGAGLVTLQAVSAAGERGR